MTANGRREGRAARRSDHRRHQRGPPGAKGINWVALATEWAPDYTTPEREALIPGILARGGAVGLAIEYLLANAGVLAQSA